MMLAGGFFSARVRAHSNAGTRRTESSHADWQRFEPHGQALDLCRVSACRPCYMIKSRRVFLEIEKAQKYVPQRPGELHQG